MGQSTYKEGKGPKICKNKSPLLAEFHKKKKYNQYISVKIPLILHDIEAFVSEAFWGKLIFEIYVRSRR